MDIAEFLVQIRVTPGCKVEEPAGLPHTVEAPFALPEDIREFYQVCGGLTLGDTTGYSITIVSPSKCVQANPVILGEATAELAQLTEGDDIAWSWYIIADYGNGNYVTIDFSQERLGRCYDSSHETHGLVGDTPIVALSLTDLLTSLYETRGQYWY